MLNVRAARGAARGQGVPYHRPRWLIGLPGPCLSIYKYLPRWVIPSGAIRHPLVATWTTFMLSAFRCEVGGIRPWAHHGGESDSLACMWSRCHMEVVEE
ncbi:hypothetical protein K431DRAFT_19320 [Polychaeton citri CBS 116435]|uniref:Uncharacterized protein n=1 Tax=Polychaeton citri CBS 116435 TaxID=1314669 RepID=A0A9P4PWT5_9PEZI|nr:hypothetical protein K431DRAFT_19320 [Polychaeton citri CBS 116435]